VCPKCGTPYHTSFKKPQKENVCDVCGSDLYQRPDDNENALKVRLQHYANDTKPLLDYYDKQGLLASFDANNSIKHIFDEVNNFLNSK
jgi:adenylate kinase